MALLRGKDELPVLAERKDCVSRVRRQRYPGGWTQYLVETFGEAPPEAAWGTATPQYMAGAPSGPDGARPDSADPRPETYIPTRIRAVSPEAIAILRSPAKRAFSQYRMEALGGTEVRTFDEAVAQLLEPGELRSARRSPTSTNSYVISGEYGRILSGYYETFPQGAAPRGVHR